MNAEYLIVRLKSKRKKKERENELAGGCCCYRGKFGNVRSFGNSVLENEMNEHLQFICLAVGIFWFITLFVNGNDYSDEE